MTREYLLNETIYLCEHYNIDYDVDNLKECSYDELVDIKECILNDFEFEDLEYNHLQDIIDFVRS